VPQSNVENTGTRMSKRACDQRRVAIMAATETMAATEIEEMEKITLDEPRSVVK